MLSSPVDPEGYLEEAEIESLLACVAAAARSYMSSSVKFDNYLVWLGKTAWH